MILRFDPTQGLVVVPTKLSGPRGEWVVRLALDTGATGSMINWDIAVLLGYDPASSVERIQVTTGSGVEYAPRIRVRRMEAVGRVRRNFSVLCHTLPPTATVDGLLGLDFFRGTRFALDLKRGTLIVGTP